MKFLKYASIISLWLLSLPAHAVDDPLVLVVKSNSPVPACHDLSAIYMMNRAKTADEYISMEKTFFHTGQCIQVPVGTVITVLALENPKGASSIAYFDGERSVITFMSTPWVLLLNRRNYDHH